MNTPTITPTFASRRRALRRAALILTLLAAPACQAYIDPNTGGFIYQLLFPLIVAVAAGWRWVKMGVSSAWHRVVTKLTGQHVSTTEPRATDAPAPPEER